MFTQIEKMVAAAQVKERCTSAEEVVEHVKWIFNGDKVQKLTRDLDIHLDNIKFVLLVLSR
jgi:hypothetical protein